MKRNLYLLSIGLVMCSCTEPGDVVTGHARILLKNQPTVVAVPAPEAVAPPAPAPEPEATPAPAPKTVATPAPEPVEEKPVLAQNQPVTTEPTPAPAEESTVIAQKQPASAEPAPAPKAEPTVETMPAPVTQEPVEVKSVVQPAPAPVEEKKTATPFFSQQQKDAAAIATKPTPAPAPAPVAQPRVVKPTVSQQQPATTTPRGVNYRTPQVTQPVRRSFPIMPGQNRGLKNRYNY